MPATAPAARARPTRRRTSPAQPAWLDPRTTEGRARGDRHDALAVRRPAVPAPGVDPKAYAARAAAEGGVDIDLPAERGRILDRNGVPLAESIAGLMIVADPTRTTRSGGDRQDPGRRCTDYFDLLAAAKNGSRFVYVARRVPSTLAASVIGSRRTRVRRVHPPRPGAHLPRP